MNTVTVWGNMRMQMEFEKFARVVELSGHDDDPEYVADYIDGGDEGWPEGDDAHQQWLDDATAEEIADWIR